MRFQTFARNNTLTVLFGYSSCLTIENFGNLPDCPKIGGSMHKIPFEGVQKPQMNRCVAETCTMWFSGIT